MPAGLIDTGRLDTFVGLNKPGWHNLGFVIDEELTATQAGEKYGMFWPVEQWTLTATGPNGETLEIPTHVANVRTRDNLGERIARLLGVVGSGYEVCPQRELAEFMDALSEAGGGVVETCGSLHGGKKVWWLMRGDSYTIGDRDRVYEYLLGTNSHDGSHTVTIAPTSIRVVCANTMRMVMGVGDECQSAAFKMRHSGNITDKLEQARNALRHYGAVKARNREMYEALAARQFDRDQAVKLFAGVYARNWEVATESDLTSVDAKVKKTAERRLSRMEDAVSAFLKRYDDEADKVGGGGSLWLAMNAATGYVQHDVRARGKDDAARVSRRIESNLFGLGSRRTQDVLCECLAMAS